MGFRCGTVKLTHGMQWDIELKKNIVGERLKD
jgi:hypothetical protein